MTPPRWKWTLTPPQPVEASSVPAILRQWHSAARLGLELKSLEKDGKPVSPRTLMLLNIWIGCGGAFNASRQDYFEAWSRLEKILNSQFRSVRRKAARKGP